eukprot:g3038.t1
MLLLSDSKLEEAQSLLEDALTSYRQKGDNTHATLFVMRELGTVLRVQGKLAEAVSLLTESVVGLRKECGDKHTHTLDALTQLGLALSRQDKPEEALPLLREALAGLRCKSGDTHFLTLVAMGALAESLAKHGKPDEALPLFNECLLGLRKALGDEDMYTLNAAAMFVCDILLSMGSLGAILYNGGNYKEARLVLQDLLPLLRRVNGDTADVTLTVMRSLGLTLGCCGNFEEARPVLEELLLQLRRLKGDTDDGTLRVLMDLTQVLRKQGQLDEAISLLKEYLSGLRKVLGDKHKATLQVMVDLGNVLSSKHHGNVVFDSSSRDPSAIAEQALALALFREALGDTDPKTLGAMFSLGVSLSINEEWDEAVSLLTECLLGYRGLSGDTHEDTLLTMLFLGSALAKQGQLDEAAPLLGESLSGLRSTCGDKDLRTLLAMSLVGDTLAAQNWAKARLSKAGLSRPLAEQVLALYKEALGETDVRTLNAKATLGMLLCSEEQQQLDKAALLLEESLVGLESAVGDTQQTTLLVRMLKIALGMALANKRRFENAQPLLEEALAEIRREEAEGDADNADVEACMVHVLEQLSAMFSLQGKLEEARPLRSEVLARLRRLHGDMHPTTLQAMVVLGDTIFKLSRGPPVNRSEERKARELLKEALAGQRQVDVDEHAAKETLSVVANVVMNDRDEEAWRPVLEEYLRHE